jgi:hypothetical protein
MHCIRKFTQAFRSAKEIASLFRYVQRQRNWFDEGLPK